MRRPWSVRASFFTWGGSGSVPDGRAGRGRAAREKRLCYRVSWGLWKTAHCIEDVGRGAEAEPIYDELIARRDEDIDPDLCEIVAWCLWHRAEGLGRSDSTEEQL